MFIQNPLILNRIFKKLATFGRLLLVLPIALILLGSFFALAQNDVSAAPADCGSLPTNTRPETARYISDEIIDVQYCYPGPDQYFYFYVQNGESSGVALRQSETNLVNMSIFTLDGATPPTNLDNAIFDGNAPGKLYYLHLSVGGESNVTYQIDLQRNLTCPSTEGMTVTNGEEWKEAIACFNRPQVTGLFAVTVQNDILLDTPPPHVVNTNPNAQFVVNGADFKLDGQNLPETRPLDILSGTQVTLNSLSIMRSEAPITGTTAEKSGGAIRNAGTLIINGGEIDSNTAQFGNGGGIANLISGTVKILDGTAITDNTAANGNGGGLFNESGAEINEGSFFTGNSAFNGGAIVNSGALTVESSIIFNNTGVNIGGGIWNEVNATAFLNNSWVGENKAPNGNGGGVINSGYLSIWQSSFTQNTADDDGAGIYNVIGGFTELFNSTFSGNIAGDDGGGIDNRGEAFLFSVTFSDNGAGDKGGGIYNKDGATTMYTSIIANSTSGGDCNNNDGTVTLGETNLVEDNSCGATGGTDPQLEPLTSIDQMGINWYYPLGENSPALNAGISFCNKADQLGTLRQSPCDLGAVEVVEYTTVDFGFESSAIVVNEADGTIQLSISISQALSADVVISYSTEDGTATSPSDYIGISPSKQVTIPAGSTATTIPITIVDDTAVNSGPSDTFILKATAMPAAGIIFNPSTDEITIAITDDDTAATTTVDFGFESSAIVANEGDGTIQLSIAISQAVSSDVVISYVTEDGTATSPSDFVGISSSKHVTIPAGSTAVTIPITIVDDTDAEPGLPQAFNVRAEALQTAGVIFNPSTTVAGVAIIDNDTAPSTGNIRIFLPLVVRSP
ncbi:MAG: Calx-beta domain-containing protein [Anaerolineae bacterium]